MRKLSIDKLMVSVAVFMLSTLSFSQELPFNVGEELDYTITYKCGFTADMVGLKMSLERGDNNLLHATCDVATYKFWDSFYKMREHYETWFEEDANLTSNSFYRNATHGRNYKATANLVFNPDNSVNVKIEKSKGASLDTVFQEGVMLRDMINSVYYSRILDYEALKSGTKVKFVMTPYRDILELQLRYIGVEEKKIGKLGVYRLLKLGLVIRPKDVANEHNGNIKIGTSDNGEYLEEERIFFWVSDDKNHVPMLFSAPASIGSIVGRITGYEGLKYELDCKVSQ